MDFAACYAITPDERFRTMAQASIASLLKFNPGTPVFIEEHDGGDYPIGIKHHALRAFHVEPDVTWLLFVDADTRIMGPLHFLEPYGGARFCGRHETMWTRGRIPPDAWNAICQAARQPLVPVFNSGAFLIPAWMARRIGDAWARWMDWLRANAEDPLQQIEAAKRFPWWMLEQCALSLAVASLPRMDWGRAQHSYQWAGEHPGAVHHFGSKRWKDFTEEL